MSIAESNRLNSDSDRGVLFRCPSCSEPVDFADETPDFDETISEILCPSCHSKVNLSGSERQSSFSLGEMQIAHFEVREVVGEGAFGTVFKAWDKQLERHVAIKVPRAGRVSPESAKQFLREARAAAGIKHTNIVQVYEVGTYLDSFYIVSQFVEGVSLSRWLKSRPLTPMEAATLLIPICEAVQAAHAVGIVHRDLKPANILVDENGVPHVTDFGLAKRDQTETVNRSLDGRLVGTPAYMSPEQARGDVSQVSHLSDVFSLGVIFYQMLTEHRPFEADDSELMLDRIRNDEPIPPRTLRKDIPRDAETICLKCLQKTPQDRYESAGELAHDLRRFTENCPIRARRPGIHERVFRAMNQNRLASVLTLIVAIMAVIMAVSSNNSGSSTKIVAPIAVTPPPTSESKLVPVSKTRTVRINYVLDGESNLDRPSRWAIVPLDNRSRLPLPDEKKIFENKSTIEIELEAGEYLVVIDIPGFGFHEVYRRLPENVDGEVRQLHPHMTWSVSKDGDVSWPAVHVLPQETVRDSMVLVPGGTYQMGDESQWRRQHSQEISTLFVDPHEVTFDMFTTVIQMPKYDLPKGAYPVAGITWHQATAYAEKVGKRLLSESEFEYLATDLGRSDVSFIVLDTSAERTWEYGKAKEPDWDCLRDYPIWGLRSNVAEWTDSVLSYYPGVTDRGTEFDHVSNRMGNRVARGGPVKLGENDRSRNVRTNEMRVRRSWDVQTMDSEIGFRCGRSQYARFVE